MTDTDSSEATQGRTSSDGAHLSAPPIITPATISTTMQPALNVALWQNHVPVLTELTLTANSAQATGDVTIDLRHL